MVNVSEALNKAYRIVCDKYGENNVIGVFLHGSQNYNLSDDESDVDVYAVTIPTLNDLIECKQESCEIPYDNGIISVKDFRLMFTCFKKQSSNFIEVLYTEFFIVNDTYKNEWDIIVSNKDNIIKYDTARFVNGLCGTIHTKHKVLSNSCNGNVPSFDGKALCEMARNYQMLTWYVDNCYKANDFSKFFKYVPDHKLSKNDALALKRGKISKYDGRNIVGKYDAESVASKIDTNAEFLKNGFTRANDHKMLCASVYDKLNVVFNSITTKIIEKSMDKT